MQLKQKRKCNGCRAFTHDAECELGYSIEVNYMDDVIAIGAVPQEPCPKPISVNEFNEALKHWKKGY